MTRQVPPGSGARDGLAAEGAVHRRGPAEERTDGVAPPAPALAETVAEATRARDRALALEARARFLAEASGLLADSLDIDTTLAGVARLAVPLLGDWCVIDLSAGDDRARRVTVAHADSDRDAAARALERLGPGDGPVPCGAPRALRTGMTELSASVGEGDLAAVRDPARRALLDALRVRAQLCVPLLARGRILGALTFVLGEPGRAFTPDGVALAEELARRVAVAVDNARLYREAERASAAKSEFLAVMTHELRTPLNVIVGFTDMLRMGIPVAIPPEALAHVERIARASEHLLGLVEQLLTSARLEAGREGVCVEPTDLAALASDLALLVEPLAAAKGLRFIVDVPGGEMRLATDPGKLRQILYNLLANAVKFTDRGEVALRVRHAPGPESDRVECEVRDTGIGIAPEHLGAVFDPFWQAEAGAPTGAPSRADRSAPRRGGSGLGLSISRDLARLLGGELQVRSTLGEGTTFTLALPTTTPDAASGTGRAGGAT
jgi:signal transduction histidine kinase